MLLLSATEKGENRSRETANRTSFGLYGTTNQGGSANYGTVYSITGNGVENVLHSFNGADGSNPSLASSTSTTPCTARQSMAAHPTMEPFTA